MGIMSMKIRKAQEKDIPRIGDLLSQVLEVHHQGRPDIFRSGAQKYGASQVLAMLDNSKTPIFAHSKLECAILLYFIMINFARLSIFTNTRSGRIPIRLPTASMIRILAW